MGIMQYRDIVIHTNAAIFGNEETVRNHPPVNQRVSLSSEIWLGRIDGPVAKAVMDTCERKTLGVAGPVRQFAQLYAFVRELPTHESIYGWDRDNRLSATIALSRLIHPTSTGYAYAARVGCDGNGLKEIYPAEIHGISVDAFLSSNRTRDWLTEPEAKILGQLVVPLCQPAGLPLPPRVHNAFWHFEYAIRTYYLDHRWTLVCTGLEALLHTDRIQNTAQFTRRVPKLAAEIGVSLTVSEAEDAYDSRSRLAHGVSFLTTGSATSPSATQIQLYDRLEDTLRLAVLRGMQDRLFGDIFRDDNQIRARWPL